MNAFHGNSAARERFIARAEVIKADYRAGIGQLGEGQYSWQVRQHLPSLILPVTGLNDNNFEARVAARERFGADIALPARIAFAYNGLFDDLPDATGPDFPVRFAKAIAVSADLSEVWRELALFALRDLNAGVLSYAQTAEQSESIIRIIELFKENSTDAEAWRQAASAARQSSHTSHSNGHGRNAKECLESVGCTAALSASYFADAFIDAGAAADAVKWAAWTERHLQEYYYFAKGGERHKAQADERGMVNVGEALWASAQNARDFHAAAQRGEIQRWRRIELFADKLLTLIKNRAPRKPRPWDPILSSRLFGIK